MSHYSRFLLATTLAIGAIGGLIVGAGLPKTHAQATVLPTPNAVLSARLTVLERRVNTLEAQVRLIQTTASPSTREHNSSGQGFGGQGFGNDADPLPNASNIPPSKIVPLNY